MPPRNQLFSSLAPVAGHSPLPRALAATLRALALGAVIAAATFSQAQSSLEVRAAATAAEQRQGYSSQRLLAQPKHGIPEQDLVTMETREGLRARRARVHPAGPRVLEVQPGEAVIDAIERLRATGHYEFVEPDYLMKAEATPNDPRFLNADQWALRNIGQSGGVAGADIRAEEAWDLQSAARNIIVALIDSGIRGTHHDLAANLWVNPAETANGRDDDGNGYIDDINGINATVPPNNAGNGTPTDVDGHGTSVASVIGAVGNNGVGMTGVAWNVRLMSLRFLDANGFGFISDEIECIDYAIAKGAHIINASFGGTSFSQALFDALKRARDAGIIVACSAGNDEESNDLYPHYPSSYLLDNIVAVANTTRTDALSLSSSFGSGSVDLGAPGTSILTADVASDSGYQFYSGTSFSAPFVAGAAALLKAKFPGDSYRETINRLLKSVDAKPTLAGKTATGGRLNLAAALRTANGRPFNDEFAQRARLEGETLVARAAALASTREVGEPVHAGAAGNGSLWWTWRAPRSGPVTFDTTGSAVDTLLAVYTGGALTALNLVASNDNESGSLNTSKVSFTATAGTSYQIAVDTKTAGTGLVLLRVALQAGNDAFDSAQLVSGRSWSVRGDNRSASRETNEPRIRNNAGGRSLWYRWVAPASRRYHLSSFSFDFNTMVGIYTGSAVGSLAEINASTTDGDSNFTTAGAGVTFSATAGTTYYIVIDSEVSTTGTSASGTFSLSCADSEWEFFGVGDPSTVAIGPDDTLHFVDAIGWLYGVGSDGARKWRYPLTGFGTFSAPAVATDGTVYAGDDLGYLHAVNPDGTQKWRVQTPGVIGSSPAIAGDGTVYIRSDAGRLYALAPGNGAIKWSQEVGTSSSTTYTSPSVAPDGTVYSAGPTNELHAFASDGTPKWRYRTDFIFSSPAIGSDGTIYFGVVAPTRRFYALRPDGTLKWEFIAGDTVSSSPTIGLDGTIYFGCADHKLYALAPSGELRWTFQAGDAIRNSSPLIASDGTIYIGCLDGKVYAVNADGTLRRTYATSGEIRSSPMVHKGRLYVSSYDFRLYAFETGHVPASSRWPMHRQNTRRMARELAQPLSIGVQPRPVAAEVGETITFAVGATGASPLSYQWMFNGRPIAGATATTLRVDPVTHATGGQYSARITDPSGTVTSNSVALTVTTPLVPPGIFAAPAAKTVVAGEAMTLAVTATGSVPITYQWSRDGTPITGATNTTLVLPRTKLADAGAYTVAITNFGGSITSAPATVTVNPISRIANLSIRSQVGGNSGTLTVGITVGGVSTAGAKPLLLRAIGPTLAAFGVDNALADPRVAILSGRDTIAHNDDWAGSAPVATTSTAVGAFALANATSKDSALLHSMNSGGYTVQINGPEASGGVALAEVYDATPPEEFFIDTPRLINVSAITQVGTGGDILITGFAIIGVTPKTVLVRGVGPTLAQFGVVGALEDPKLELFQSGAAAATATNDNWSSAANAAQVRTAALSVGAFALGADSRDAALLITLAPGAYTAQVSGVSEATGIALVEVYEVP